MDKKTSIFGIVLVVLGALWLLSRFEVHLFQFLLPAALIVLGVWFIRKKQRSESSLPPPPPPSPHRPSSQPMPPPPPPPPQAGYGSRGASMNVTPEGNFNATSSSGATINVGPSGVHAQAGPTGGGGSYSHSGGHYTGGTAGAAAYPQFEAGKIKYSKFIGDMFIECQNINMQNVEISMFIGDLQVNLGGGRLTPGLNRMIVSGFLGDIMVLVPKGMPVYVHCSGFVGDLDLLGRRSSGFGNTIDAQTPEYDSADAKLYVAINHFVGDIRVYSV